MKTRTLTTLRTTDGTDWLRWLGLTAWLALALLAAGPAAVAQEAATKAGGEAEEQAEEQDGMAEFANEVTVTATRVETDLMDTGVSVTAYDSEMLDDVGIDDLRDISAYTPSLSMTSNDRVTVRGIGQDSTALGIDAGVASYTDGVYSRGVALFRINNFFDVERIEVVRGPQGTLYGRNTAGGAINVISKKPGPEFGGELNLELGTEGYQVLQAAVNVPLHSEKVWWRVAASSIERDPLVDNINPDGIDISSIKNTSIDTTLSFNWTERWITDVRFFTSERSGVPNSGYKVQPHDFTTFSFPGGTTPNPNFGYTTPNPTATDLNKVDLNYPNSLQEDITRVILTNVFDLGNFDLKYIGGITDFERTLDLDVDYSSSTTTNRTNIIRPQYDTTTHELQLISKLDGSFNFILGAYRYESEESLYWEFGETIDPIYSTSVGPFDTVSIPAFGLFNVPGIALGLPPFEGDPLNRPFWYDSNLDATSTALFGQLTYDLSDTVTMTFGARSTEDEKAGDELVYVFVPLSADFSGLGVPIYADVHNAVGTSIGYPFALWDQAAQEDSWNSTDFNLRFDWKPSDNTFFYASVSTGYRAGGFNLGSLSPGVDDFEPEDLTAYEVGFKGTLAQRLRLTASAYFYDYSDLQVLQQFFDPATGAQGTEFNNAAQAEVQGLELEALFFANENVDFGFAYAYNNAEYTEFLNIDDLAFGTPLAGVVQDLSGNKMNRAPENKFSILANFNWDAGAHGFRFSGQYSFTDDFFISPFNTPISRIDSHDRVDARFTWTPPGGRYTVTAYGKNLSDDRHLTDVSLGVLASGLVNVFQVTDPQILGLRFNYKW